MSEIDLKRLVDRLWKCPFDGELFDSRLSFREHLCELHGDVIGNQHRRKWQISLGEIDERPEKLNFCAHCFDFVVPSALDRSPVSEIDAHIREQHPNPSGLRELKLSITRDSKLIDQFMEQQAVGEVHACTGCNESFSDEASVAEHWIGDHCDRPTSEDVAHALATKPQFIELLPEDILRIISADESEPDDGYIIRHSPDVPRIRSRPAEHIVFVDRQPVRFLDEELQELLEYEGLDSEGAVIGEPFDGSGTQCVHVDLRFCNILDGYIPLVKAVRDVLPQLPERGLIEVCWEDESEVWFPCTVSKRKRAIYNLDQRLKPLFERFDSGVRLYITRVGSKRYKLGVRRQPHVVRDCKLFVFDERKRWRVEVRDLTVEWETSNEVFRHQLTLEQREALYAEAKRTNLSIRDAVYKVMEQFRHLDRVHVRNDVYEAVYLPLRTCSLASVWAQFRPEHECYVRVSPGWYRFDSSKPFPLVRYVAPARRQVGNFDRAEVARTARTKIRVRVRWKLLGKDRDDDVFDTGNSAETMAEFLGSLIREYGSEMGERLTRIPVSRGHPLSGNPEIEFVNPVDDTPYCYHSVTGTELHVLTNSSTREKHDDIRRLVNRLGLSSEGVEVSIVPNPTRAEILAAL